MDARWLDASGSSKVVGKAPCPATVLPILSSRNHTESPACRSRVGHDLPHPAIESCKPPSSGERESEQVGVHELSVAGQMLAKDELRRTERGVVRPEDVARYQGHFFQEGDGLGRLSGVGQDAIIGGNSHESCLRQRACRPAIGSRLPEPTMGRLVMNVVRPRQRDQDVDVEQRDHSPSSSARRTISSVIGGAPGGIRKTGKPRFLPGAFGVKPLRARFETTRPRLVS